VSNLYFVNKRERWGLTVWGWLVVLVAVGAAGLFGFWQVNRFLSTTSPVEGQILVVEAWIPDYAIRGVRAEFEKHEYQILIAVGGQLGLGAHLSQYRSSAVFTQARLEEIGFEKEKIVVIETSDIKKDRTHESARAVQQWIASNGVSVKALNVYTLGAHARRSRLLFQKVFGNGVEVGVIAAHDYTYDPDHWWRSSNGVRTVVSELIAYSYAVIFFDLWNGQPGT
jgi:hypothetical protein